METIYWKICAIIIPSLIGIWGIWYFLLIPKLSYFINILPFINPSNVDKSIKNKLKIIYNNQEVEQLSLARVIICNEGRGVADNFSSPITIKFNKKILYVVPDKKILASGIVNEYVISKDSKKVEFTPQFINQGESISFDFVLESVKDIDIVVTGRCKACSSIKKVQGTKKHRITSTILSTVLTILIFVSFFLTGVAFSLKKDIEKGQIELIESYHKLFNIFENDDKKMHEIANNIKTYGDAVEAYVICEEKLRYYIDYAKRNISNDLKKFHKQDSTQLPK